MDKFPRFFSAFHGRRLPRIPLFFARFFHELSSVRNLRASLGILSLFALFTVIFLMQQQLTAWHIENLNVDPQKKYILLHRVPPWMEALEAGDECVITANEKLLPSIEMYDAVVFSSESQINFPKKRSPDQLYVFTSRETPLYTKNNFQKDLMQYNLTMTYRRDSDIFWPSGFIADAAIDASAWEFRSPKWKHAVFEKYGANVKLTSIIADKSKFSAWLKSQCTDKSMRIDFMSILENYIEIDIYGECGRLDCSGTQDECLEMVERDYFFIFIAENSICKDFITEALFSAMRFYIVPVVYGGANYGDFLPPHSFIDANKFNRTTELADFLQRLASDPAEYAKFFWWKKFYPQVTTKRTLRGLCRAIQEFSTRPARTGRIANIQSWWQDNSQCAQAPIIQLI